SGFLNTQAILYTGWSGRFTATLLVTLSELVGPAAVPLLPSLALLVWLVATTWAIGTLANAFRWQVQLPRSAVMAVLLVYATLQTTADMPQVLYWQTGMLTYLLPLLLTTVYVGWVARFVGSQAAARRPLATAGTCCVLAFLAGG